MVRWLKQFPSQIPCESTIKRNKMFDFLLLQNLWKGQFTFNLSYLILGNHNFWCYDEVYVDFMTQFDREVQPSSAKIKIWRMLSLCGLLWLVSGPPVEVWARLYFTHQCCNLNTCWKWCLPDCWNDFSINKIFILLDTRNYKVGLLDVSFD